MIRTYTVRWEIEVEAASRKDAAKKARAIQQDPTNTATFYDVALFNQDGNNPFTLIELERK